MNFDVQRGEDEQFMDSGIWHHIWPNTPPALCPYYRCKLANWCRTAVFASQPPLWQLPRWVGLGEDCQCRAFLTHGWVSEFLAWREDWHVPLPNMLRTLITVVPSSQEKFELKHLNYSQFWEPETSIHSALSKMRTKLAGRFESTIYSFSCSQLFSPTDFSHHVILPLLPPPCKTEVWLQGANSHADNSPCLTSSNWHFWYAFWGKTGILSPRERTSSLRNFFPGEQNGARQTMQISSVVGHADKETEAGLWQVSRGTGGKWGAPQRAGPDPGRKGTGRLWGEGNAWSEATGICGSWSKEKVRGLLAETLGYVWVKVASTRRWKSAGWQEDGSWGVMNGKAGGVDGDPDH